MNYIRDKPIIIPSRDEMYKFEVEIYKFIFKILNIIFLNQN